MFEDRIEGDTIYCQYDSVEQYADAAKRRRGMGPGVRALPNDPVFSHGTLEEITAMARDGWDKHLPETLNIVESAVELTEKDDDFKRFVPVWDVQGAEVDVAKYLSGEEECMIDYPLTEVPTTGRIITLCASISMSSAVSVDTAVRRGQIIAALGLALTRMGYGCELWADMTTSGEVDLCDVNYSSVRVLVKGANDTVDPSKILFAFAHPGMLRELGLSVYNGLPVDLHEALHVGFGRNYGYPESPIQNLPEGTIYLPELLTDKDVPAAGRMLKDLLRQIGILAES